MGTKNQSPRQLGPGWEYYTDEKGRLSARKTAAPTSPVDSSPSPKKSIGRKRKGMNKTERELFLILKARFPSARVYFEPMTFLCSSCRYTVDFMVCASGYPPQFYECKGPYKREKDVLRLRAAAAEYPFRFVLAQKLADGWEYIQVRGLIQ